MIAINILKDLWSLNRVFCSTDYDFCLDYLQKILPFTIHTYTTEKPFKGWEIPPKWDFIKGSIKKNGVCIFEVNHPLKIISLSTAFSGSVSLEELKKHLHTDKRDATSIPFHFRQLYRPWDRTWGFCVTQDFFDSLTEGLYEVHIEVKEAKGYLKVAEYVKQGKEAEIFTFVAHLDHPGMVNDDLAGVAVGVDLFHQLSKKETKFSYRLLLVQEIIGSVFFLENQSKENMLEGCFLEMLASSTPLHLQRSKAAKGIIEQSIIKNDPSIKQGAFREVICNDEAVFESYKIPMCSLSRFPYKEYHSDKDNLSIVSEKSLIDTLSLLSKVVDDLEKETLILKNFEGFYGLAHPDFNLYIDPGQPAFNCLKSCESAALRRLMDEIPLMPNKIFLSQLSKELDLPHEKILNYLKLWQEKNLLKIV